MPHRCHTVTVLCLAAIACASPAALAAAPEAGTPLGGPSLHGSSDRDDTLIKRGYDGLIAPLDAPPAIAALRLLDLDDDATAQVQAVLADRWALLDGLVRKHALLLSEVEPALTAGSPGEKFSVIQRSLAALAPLRAWGKLPRRVAEALPSEARARYTQLVTEYERAKFDELIATGKADSPIAARMDRYWTDLGWEIERSAERVFQEDDGDGLAKLIE